MTSAGAALRNGLSRLWFLHAGTPARLIISIMSLAALVRSYSFTYRRAILPPWFDYWRWVSDYQLWVEGRFGFYDLIKLHNEHRIATTKLLLLLDSIAFEMNGRSTIIINLAVLAVVGVLLWRITRLDGIARGTWDTPPLFWIALLCAVCQYGNLIFPFQIQFALTCMFACAAAWLLAEATRSPPPRAGWQAGGAGVLVILALFSMGSGLFLAPALILLLALRRAQARVWAIFIPLCVAGIVLFFYHYDAASNTRPPLLDLALVPVRIRYVADFIASALSALPALATIAGFCAVGCFGAVALHRLRPRLGKRTSITVGDAALFGLGAFVVMSAMVGTLTERIYLGAHAALVTRYATMSLLFVAILLGLCIRWLADSKLPNWMPGSVQIATTALLLGVMNLPYYDQYARGYGGAIRAEDELLRNNIGIEGPAPVAYTGGIPTVRDAVVFLHAQKLSIFAPENGPPSALLARIANIGATVLPVCSGTVETSYGIDSGGILLSGWIANPSGSRIPSWIAAIDSAGRLLGTAHPLSGRPEFRGGWAMDPIDRGFDAGFRLAADDIIGDRDAAISVRVLGLFPGKKRPLCELASPAHIGPILIEPADELRDIAFVSLAAQPSPALTTPVTAPGGKPAWRVPVRPNVPFEFRFNAESSQRAVAVPFLAHDGSPAIGVTFVMRDGTRFTAQTAARWTRYRWQAAALSESLVVRHQGVSYLDIDPGENTDLLIGTPLWATLNPTWSKLF